MEIKVNFNNNKQERENVLYSHNPWNLDTLKKNNELSLKSVKKKP